MSENEETATALDRIRGWREEYRLGLAPSPLEDVTQLSAQLDLTHAHPSGIAQLFAKGHVTLDSLFRDNGMLRAAGRRVERVLDDRDAKSRVSGVGELSLVVGVAIWKGNQMPVLMYPVEVRKEGRNIENGTVIAFTGRVRLNAAFAAVMRENNVTLDETKLFDGSNYESGTPKRPRCSRPSQRARPAFSRFRNRTSHHPRLLHGPVLADAGGKSPDHQPAVPRPDRQHRPGRARREQGSRGRAERRADSRIQSVRRRSPWRIRDWRR